MGTRLDEVFIAIGMHRLLGGDNADARAAVERAREMLTGLGGSPLLGLLEERPSESPPETATPPEVMIADARAPSVRSGGS